MLNTHVHIITVIRIFIRTECESRYDIMSKCIKILLRKHSPCLEHACTNTRILKYEIRTVQSYFKTDLNLLPQCFKTKHIDLEL